ncbi:hypothetical protein DL93DRAFT_2170497 [Clavulina sp. PMI_390]|nr:hypothetical protein DL93DRAFT_2170497 [Clavulina sp. PMI_390]
MEGGENDVPASLIRYLPDELILSIFLHLRKHYDWTNAARLNTTLTIALAASALWSELVFRVAEVQDLWIAARTARMEACLLRSCTHQLNIYFDWGSNDAIVPLEIFNRFVAPNLWRCRSLEVVVPNHEVALVIFPLPYDLSFVKSFGVIIENSLDYDPEFMESVEVGGLHGVHFSPSSLRINAEVPIHLPHLDTSNLEALYVFGVRIGYSAILQLLQRSKNLKRMHLGFYYLNS